MREWMYRGPRGKSSHIVLGTRPKSAMSSLGRDGHYWIALVFLHGVDVVLQLVREKALVQLARLSAMAFPWLSLDFPLDGKSNSAMILICRENAMTSGRDKTLV